MAHDVFISHSSIDKTIADATCAYLEARNIRCWIAPRDILPGADWSGSILDAIVGARVMVLILSSSANASPQIKREAERAVHHGLVIIPMRIEDVLPAKELEFFLSTPHWLDAFTDPLESHLDFLTVTVKQILSGPGTAASRPVPRPIPWWRRNLLWLGIGGVSFLVIFLLLLILLRPSSGGAPGAGDIGRFAGKWKETSTSQTFPSVGTYLGLPGITQAAFADSDSPDEVTIGSDGTYELHRVKRDNGTYSPSYLAPQGDNLMGQGTFTSARDGNSDRVTMMIMPGSAMAANPLMPQGSQLLSLTPQGGGAGSIWARNSSSNSPVGEWSNPKTYVMDGAQGATLQNIYASTLDLTDDGHYKIEFEMTQKGVFALQGPDAYTITLPNAQPESGQYSFDGRNTMTLVAPDGRTVWQRE